jgi:hypothetical protein
LVFLLLKRFQKEWTAPLSLRPHLQAKGRNGLRLLNVQTNNFHICTQGPFQERPISSNLLILKCLLISAGSLNRTRIQFFGFNGLVPARKSLVKQLFLKALAYVVYAIQ